MFELIAVMKIGPHELVVSILPKISAFTKSSAGIPVRPSQQATKSGHSHALCWGGFFARIMLFLPTGLPSLTAAGLGIPTSVPHCALLSTIISPLKRILLVALIA